MTKFKKLIIFSLILVMGFVFFGRIYAANETSAAKTWPKIEKIVDMGTLIGISVAFLAILMGGVCYILSLGGIKAIATTKLLGSGKDQIKAGFTALLILATFYTLMSIINPGWTSFSELTGITLGEEKLEELKNGDSDKIPAQEYQEIPLGTTVENVLARGINCFEFDGQGDIVDSDPSTKAFDLLANNDRLDCAKRIVEAIKIKNHKLIKLVIAYQEFLKECRCHGNDRCECKCAGKPCIEQSCEYKGFLEASPTLVCPPNCELPEPPKTAEEFCSLVDCPCPKGTELATCKTDPDKGFYGPCPPETIEKMVNFWKEYFEVDALPPLLTRQCPDEPPGCRQYYRDETFYLGNFLSLISGSRPYSYPTDYGSYGGGILGAYKKLKILDHLEFLKLELNNLMEGLKADKKSLESAKEMVEKDYLVEPYVEFVKITEEIEKETGGEIKIKTFIDPQKKEVLPDKYCKGFNHLGLHKKCFGDSFLADFFSEEHRFQAHLNACAGPCTDYCRKKTGIFGQTLAKKYFECIEITPPCDCVCETAKDKTQCKSTCNECITECDKEFSWCKPLGENKEYPRCKEQRNKCDVVCDNKKSECNKECGKLFKGDDIKKCQNGWEKYFGESSFWEKIKKIVSKIPGINLGVKKYGCDQEHALCQSFCQEQEEDCVSDCYNTYLFPCYTKCYGTGCQFCSDQQAGYKECSVKNYPLFEKAWKGWWKAPINLLKLFGLKEITCDIDNYSSYDFFSWWQERGCIINPLCLRGKGYFGVFSYSGIEDYPQALKCPTCSNCPECPCLTCSGECGEYAYDTDPLTFYSKIGETQEEYPGPLGEKMVCDRKREIPVGRLVDKTIEFPKEVEEVLEKVRLTVKITEHILSGVKPFIVDVVKTPGHSPICGPTVHITERYNIRCEGWGISQQFLDKLDKIEPAEITVKFLDNLFKGPSGSRCESGCEPYLHAIRTCLKRECTKWENGECIEDECVKERFEGWQCRCRILPCEGVISFEKEIKALEKVTDILDYFSNEFKEGQISGKETIAGKRSELLKMLTYSRKKMNECAELYVEFRTAPEKSIGKEELRERIKLLKCFRVIDEGLQKECYGTMEKDYTFEDTDKMDDWYCCEKIEMK